MCPIRGSSKQGDAGEGARARLPWALECMPSLSLAHQSYRSPCFHFPPAFVCGRAGRTREAAVDGKGRGRLRPHGSGEAKRPLMRSQRTHKGGTTPAREVLFGSMWVGVGLKEKTRRRSPPAKCQTINTRNKELWRERPPSLLEHFAVVLLSRRRLWSC